jgi:ornithine cyclodeaminase
LFDLGAVQPATHLNCVGADTKGKRELQEGLLKIARVCSDDEAQGRRSAKPSGIRRFPCIEIGDLIAGKVRLDRGPKEITLFDMTGLALQDLTVARLLVAPAQDGGAVMSVPRPW